MPLTVMLAHQLNKKIADRRKDGSLWWARPDSKAQVGKCYKECMFSNINPSPFKLDLETYML